LKTFFPSSRITPPDATPIISSLIRHLLQFPDLVPHPELLERLCGVPMLEMGAQHFLDQAQPLGGLDGGGAGNRTLLATYMLGAASKAAMTAAHL